MVNTYGQWFQEDDYSTYPKEKWCDYDIVCMAILEDNYIPKTSMNHLIDMVFGHYDDNSVDVYEIIVEVRENGGWKEFDYEP